MALSIEPIVTLTAVAMVLAVGIGANDETFSPLVGSKKLTINQAVVLGGVTVIIGATVVGIRVATTVGTGIIKPGSVNMTTNIILVILFSVAISLILGSWKGLPLSTTHAMVGSVITIGIISSGSIAVIQLNTVFRILASWVISPVLGFVGSYFIMKGIARFKDYYIQGLDDVDFIEMLFSRILIVAVIITAFSRGGNDVSNAMAPILPLYLDLVSDTGNPLIARVPLFLGGISMAIGLILIGRRVLATLGNDVVELSPTTALSVQLSTAIITLTAATLGIPVSGTHILVSAFVGTGIAAKSKINKKTVKVIAISAVGTPFFSAAVTFIVYQIMLVIV